MFGNGRDGPKYILLIVRFSPNNKLRNSINKWCIEIRWVIMARLALLTNGVKGSNNILYNKRLLVPLPGAQRYFFFYQGKQDEVILKQHDIFSEFRFDFATLYICLYIYVYVYFFFFPSCVFVRSVGWLVGHDYPKGWEVTLPCSYRSTCSLWVSKKQKKKIIVMTEFNSLSLTEKYFLKICSLISNLFFIFWSNHARKQPGVSESEIKKGKGNHFCKGFRAKSGKIHKHL